MSILSRLLGIETRAMEPWEAYGAVSLWECAISNEHDAHYAISSRVAHELRELAAGQRREFEKVARGYSLAELRELAQEYFS